MKLNGTPRHYMPLSQSQSDDEENPSKLPKFEKGSTENLNIHGTFNPGLLIPKHSCDDLKKLPMSPLRTFAFISSLFLCILFIVTLAWLFPCEASHEKTRLEEWSVILQNMSLTSDISVARTTSFSSLLIIFGFSRLTEQSQNPYGLMALRKSDGIKKWELDLHFEVMSVLCNYIDFDGDGCKECLIIGKTGIITAVEPISGKNLWFLHSHETHTVSSTVSMPTILPDCDSDGISELAVSYAISTDSKSAYMGLFSGSTGKAIGIAVLIPHCVSPVIAHQSMTLRNKTAFVFYCIDGKAGYLFFSYADDFFNVVMNRTTQMNSATLYRAVPFFSNVQFYKASESELAVIFNGTKCILITVTDNQKLKPKWIFKFNTEHWRAAAHGTFILGQGPQLIFISQSNSDAKVSGILLSNGKKMWSTSFTNRTITSAFILPKFFSDGDGIVLKMIIAVPNDKPKLQGFYTENNTEIPNETNKDIRIIEENLDVQLVEENYVLLHHEDLHFTKISSQQIRCICKGRECNPDVYSGKSTAVATVLNNEEIDVAVLSSALLPFNVSRQLLVQTTVNLLKLEKFSQFSKCMYKSCY